MKFLERFNKEKNIEWYTKREKSSYRFLNVFSVFFITTIMLYISLPFWYGTKIGGIKIEVFGSYLSGITSMGVLFWAMLGQLHQLIVSNRQALEVKDNLSLTRESLELSRSMHMAERLERFSANQPHFTQTLPRKFDHGNKAYIAFSFKNIGFPATDIYIKNSQGYCCSEKVDILGRGDSVRIRTEFSYFLDADNEHKVPMSEKCWVHYRDNIGMSRHVYAHLYWFPFPVNGVRIPNLTIDMPESPEQSIPTFDNEPENVD